MFSYHKDLLANGLRVVTVEVPHLHAGVLAVYVRSGSRHETPETNGVSHFLEHLFFRGCDRFPDGRALNARVEDVGGSLNGVTTRDHGYYYTPIHPKHIAVGIETIGAMLTRPLLKEIDIEREVILEEMLDEVDEDGRDIDVDNVSKREAFGDHPLAFKIAGTPETVRSIDRDMLVKHHEQFYCATNMVFAAAGPIQREQVLELAREYFGDLPRGVPSADRRPPPWPAGPRFAYIEHEESQAELRLSFPVPPEDHPDFPAVMALRRILDDGLSTRLQVNLVDRRGLAYSVHAGVDAFSDVGMFEVDVACANSKLDAACVEMLRTLGELASSAVEPEELVRARMRHNIGFEFSLDSAPELAGWFGGTELFRTPESFAERMKKFDAVTADDIRRVASQTFRRSNMICAIVGHLDRTQLRTLETTIQRATSLPE